MMNVPKRLWNEEDGQDLSEYGLMLVLLALAIVAGAGLVGAALSLVFKSTSANTSAS
ncbi:MAG TPA: Flp family type IVb pilin [Terriglobia bacterium]|nr:Flp family type IVb pilin [Terriglobia bacterium]